MITIRYVDLLLTLLVLCAAVSTVVLVAASLRVRSTLERLDLLLDRTGDLVPRLERLALTAGEATERFARASESADRIAGDIASMTTETREVALPLIRELGEHGGAIQGALRQISALLAGTRAGLAAMRKGAA